MQNKLKIQNVSSSHQWYRNLYIKIQRIILIIIDRYVNRQQQNAFPPKRRSRRNEKVRSSESKDEQ